MSARMLTAGREARAAATLMVSFPVFLKLSTMTTALAKAHGADQFRQAPISPSNVFADDDQDFNERRRLPPREKARAAVHFLVRFDGWPRYFPVTIR
jgi:hypothetical protein